jgi:DNA-binding XRE family transcriptional regulator
MTIEKKPRIINTTRNKEIAGEYQNFDVGIYRLSKKYNLSESRIIQILKDNGVYDTSEIHSADGKSTTNAAQKGKQRRERYLLYKRANKTTVLPKQSLLCVIRKTRDLTQQQAADKIGISLRSYIRIENGDVTPFDNTLSKISKLFGQIVVNDIRKTASYVSNCKNKTPDINNTFHFAQVSYTKKHKEVTPEKTWYPEKTITAYAIIHKNYAYVGTPVSNSNDENIEKIQRKDIFGKNFTIQEQYTTNVGMSWHTVTEILDKIKLPYIALLRDELPNYSAQPNGSEHFLSIAETATAERCLEIFIAEYARYLDSQLTPYSKLNPKVKYNGDVFFTLSGDNYKFTALFQLDCIQTRGDFPFETPSAKIKFNIHKSHPVAYALCCENNARTRLRFYNDNNETMYQTKTKPITKNTIDKIIDVITETIENEYPNEMNFLNEFLNLMSKYPINTERPTNEPTKKKSGTEQSGSDEPYYTSPFSDFGDHTSELWGDKASFESKHRSYI